MRRKVGRGQAIAVGEVLAVSAGYILVATTAVDLLDWSGFFPDAWSPDERATGSGFLVGAAVQLALILAGAYILRLPEIRHAIAATLRPSTRKAWSIAAIATAIHIGTALLLFLPEPGRVFEPSGLNGVLSTISAADGWSQEILFRGYVLFRLARGGLPGIAQILMSGGLFAAIHFGYAGETPFEFLAPLIGTLILGCFYAWAVRSGGGSLKPVIACHILIILVLQPWLALHR